MAKREVDMGRDALVLPTVELPVRQTILSAWFSSQFSRGSLLSVAIGDSF